MKTVGQILLESELPEDLRQFAAEPISKKRSKALHKQLALKYPDRYADILGTTSRMALRAATDYGDFVSPGLEDLRPSDHLQREMKKIRDHVDSIVQSDIPSETKNKRITEYLAKHQDRLRELAVKEGVAGGNAFAIGVKQGYRGKPIELGQLLLGDMINVGADGKPVPIPGLHGYGEGLTTAEQMAGAYGSMMGFANVQTMTARAGYLGKQLGQIAGDIKVTGPDCGAEGVGFVRDAGDPDNFGKVLSRDTGDFKAGTVLDENVAGKLRGQEVMVRDPLTCQQRYGVCQRCIGKGENDKFPTINSYVGLTTAGTASEPMIQQLGLESKHRGGTMGKDDVNLSGYEEINQMYQMSESFKGAELAPVDGKVTAVRKAPQGGRYVKVGGEQLYVPEDRTLRIKEGDEVEAGDPVTEGPINPKEIVKYKGIGEGRRLVAEQQLETLGKSGIDITDRQSKILARGFVDHVRITSPEGEAGYPPGKIVTYSELQDMYRPREDAMDRKPEEARGQYLEKPVLHYTIGTRVTPRIAQDIKKNWGQNVTVHDKPPGFEPYMHRAADISSIHQDWKTRLGGFGIQRALLDAAQKGSVSKRDSSSYIPDLMNPTVLRNRLTQSTSGKR